MQRHWICWCAALVVAFSASGASAAVTTVFSNNPAPGDFFTNPGAPPNVSQAVGASGWSYNNVRVGGTIGINTTYPRSGSGSVYMQSLDGVAKADIEYSSGVLGTLGSLTSLSYEYYRDGSSTAAGHLHPSLRLLYDADGNFGTSNDRGYLIYEQVYNANVTVPTNTWITDNVFGANFWMTNFSNPNGSILAIYDRTLAEWATTPNPNPAYPTLSNSTVIFGLSSGFGSGWNGTFTGAIDNITIGFSERDPTTFNFEVAQAPVPEPATLALWTVLSAAAGAIQLRRRRK